MAKISHLLIFSKNPFWSKSVVKLIKTAKKDTLFSNKPQSGSKTSKKAQTKKQPKNTKKQKKAPEDTTKHTILNANRTTQSDSTPPKSVLFGLLQRLQGRLPERQGGSREEKRGRQRGDKGGQGHGTGERQEGGGARTDFYSL